MLRLSLTLGLMIATPAAAAIAPTAPSAAATSVDFSTLVLDPSLARARALMTLVGIEDLADAGTVDLSTVSIAPGVYALSPDACGLGALAGPSGPPSPPTGGVAAACTGISGWFSTYGPATYGGLFGSGSGTVVQYTGEEMSDIAVIVADHVIFEDATLTLSSSVRELWIIARSVESSSSTITWEGAGRSAASISGMSAASAGTPSYNPTVVSSASAFRSPSGGAGTAGASGRTGNAGRSAPDVHVVVVDVLAGADGVRNLPQLNLSGEAGGAGQAGQAGGRGGHGARGANAVANLVNCTQGAGWGGNGGAGGAGGRGGAGGAGGAGGDIELLYVNGLTPTVASSRGGGAAGAGGSAGSAGAGGTGGLAGAGVWPYCREEPTRAGRNGSAGAVGSRGAAGTAGVAGTLTTDTIDYETWEALFTSPWLVGAVDPVVDVGAPLELMTENITGGARAILVDQLTGTVHVLPLVASAPDVYTLSASETAQLSAGRYTLTIERSSDDALTENVYEVEFLPVLLDVAFADAFDALPNGQAVVHGRGLRDELGLTWDGVPMVVTEPVDDGDVETWTVTIPAIAADSAGKFLRDDGRTLHDIEITSPWPMTPSPALLQTTLLRHDGLTFLPSVNAYSWSNGDMTDEVKSQIQGDLWGAFEQTFGGVEVDASMIASPLGTGALFGMYAAWWSDGLASANCLGMSTHVLSDFFAGVTGVPAEVRADVAWNIGITQGKLLSEEVLGGLIAESDASLWIERPVIAGVADFLHAATDADAMAMPVLVMVPDVHFIEESLINLLLPESLETGESEFDELNMGVGKSHALAPYLVAYADVSDALPTRVYVYDSNAAGDGAGGSQAAADGVFFTVADDGVNLTWSYDFFEATDPEYTFGSTGGWTMASVPVGVMLGDVSLLGNLLD